MDKDLIIKQLGEVALKNLNITGALTDTIDLILEPALQEMVTDSENTYDDMAKAALYPILAQFLKAEIAKLEGVLKEKLIGSDAE